MDMHFNLKYNYSGYRFLHSVDMQHHAKLLYRIITSLRLPRASCRFLPSTVGLLTELAVYYMYIIYMYTVERALN